MEKFILALLEDNNRVIIPNFGSFIKRPGGNNEIAFNEFLKFDDGLLTNYIVVKQKLSKEKAKDEINKFIKNVLNAFEENKSFPLGSLGELKKNANGKIELVNTTTAPLNESETTNETTPPAEKKETKTTPPKVEVKQTENTKIEEKKTEKTKVEEKKETSPPKVTETTKPQSTNPENTKKEPEIKKTTPPPPPVSKPVEPKKEEVEKVEPVKSTPPSTLQKTTTPPPAKKTTTSTPPPVKTGSTSTSGNSNSEGNSKTIILVIAAVLVVGLLVSGFIFRAKLLPKYFDKTKKVENVKKTTTKKTSTKNVATQAKKTSVHKSDSTKKDTVNKVITNNVVGKSEENTTPVKDTPAKKEVTAPTVVASNNHYHIVAGCFKDKWRAEKYAEKLQNTGFPNARIFGLVGSYHGVCYDSYPTKPDALQEMKKIRNEQQLKAWVTFK